MERKAKIMFIDDEPNVLRALERILRKQSKYQADFTSNPEEVFQALKQEDYALVVSDQRMPVMEGVEVLKQVSRISPQSVKMMLTGYADTDSAIRAINEGKIFRFLSKPWNEESLVGMIDLAISQYWMESEIRSLAEITEAKNDQLHSENGSLASLVAAQKADLQRAHQEMRQSFLSSLKVLGTVAETLSPVLAGKSTKVARLAGRLAREVGASEREVFTVEVAGYLHNLGEVGFSSNIGIGPEMGTIAERGAAIAKQMANIGNAAELIRHQFERWDGLGFPSGLSSKSIPRGARILAVAGAFVAASKGSEDGLERGRALALLEKDSGRRFDPELISALESVVGGEPLKSDRANKIALMELKVGMELAQALYTDQGEALLEAGQRIEEGHLSLLLQRRREGWQQTHVRVRKAA
jgi:response regulator RpfG family c-di-GMP phosphodiesterase